MKYKHVFGPLKYSMWQVTIFGHAVRSGCNFPSPEDAAVSCQLFKHYLNATFRLQLADSIEDGEQFSTLAYRRNVLLSDSLSVFSSLTETAKLFIDAHRAELEAHRELNPESIADKFRRSGMIENPAIRDWVNSLDTATQDAKDFASINGEYFLTLMNGIASRSADILKPVSLAITMHDGVTNPRLVARLKLLTELQAHLQATSEHIKFLTAQFESESVTVFSALATLESNRPVLT